MFVFTGRFADRDDRSVAETDGELRKLQQREAALLRELDALKADKRASQAQAAKAKAARRRHNSRGRRGHGQPAIQQQDQLLLSSQLMLDDDEADEDGSCAADASEEASQDALLSASRSPDGKAFSPVFTLPAIGSPTSSPHSARGDAERGARSPSQQSWRSRRPQVPSRQRMSLQELEEEQFTALLQRKLGMTREEIELLRAPARGLHNTDEAIAAAIALDVEPHRGRGSRIVDPLPARVTAAAAAAATAAAASSAADSSGGGARRRHPRRSPTRGSSGRKPKRRGQPPRQLPPAARRGRGSARAAAETAEALRRQLTSSIGSVQQHTHSVRHDIDLIRQMAPIADGKARRFMQRWSAEKLFQIGGRLLFKLVARRFARWVAAARALRLEEKRREYERLLAARTILRVVSRAAYLPLLRMGFVAWVQHRDETRAVEEDAANYVQALVIQNQARVWLACRRRDLMIYRREHQLEWGGAIRIQAAYRGTAGRRAGQAYMHAERDRRAATHVQRVVRGQVGRKKAAAQKRAQDEEAAALKLQQAVRGSQARRELRLRKARANEYGAATKINAMARRVRDRKRAGRLAERRRRARAAAKVQATVRGRRERQKVKMMRAKRAMERRRQGQAARKVQAVYRGHRGRLSTYIIMMEHNEKKLRETNAAKTIQRFWHRALGTSSALKASAANLLLMVGQAKLYTQYKDDSAGKMFYHNAATDESLWEPPATGYISTDGTFVLANGQELKPEMSTRLAKDSWKKFRDADSGDTYWFNSATGVTAWSNPLPDVELPFSDESKSEKEQDPASGLGAAPPAGAGDSNGGNGADRVWRQYADEETGQPYWGNEAGETTWDNPYAYAPEQ